MHCIPDLRLWLLLAEERTLPGQPPQQDWTHTVCEDQYVLVLENLTVGNIPFHTIFVIWLFFLFVAHYKTVFFK